MGRNMTRQILEQKIGRSVRAGEIHFTRVDCVMTHDVGTAGVSPLLEKYESVGRHGSMEHVIILDHFVPATTLIHAQSHQLAREFARRWQVDAFYEVGRGGICHQVLLENGHARPGNLLLATDAHVTTCGGVGCLGLGVGVTDVAMALHTGEMWIKVPEVIGIELQGRLAGGTAKDLALHLLGMIPFSQLNYRVVEFFGDGAHSLSMDDRFCLCNMLSEGGVKSCLVSCDEKTEQYILSRTSRSYRLVQPEPDAAYELLVSVDLTDIGPMVARPHHPTRTGPVKDVCGIEIQQAFLGSCTNGRIEDLRVGAAIVRGKQVHPNVRFVVTPASQRIYLQAMEEGLIRDFIQAGALVTNPSCGACIGASSLLSPGEVCISTSNRNFRGRMGSIDACIYLASPATIAYSALAGRITDGAAQRRG